MNKTTEALKLAEEALDELRYANDTDIAKTKYYKALAAIREALAEPDIEEMTLTQIASRHEPVKQEPVAWRVHPFGYGVGHEGAYAMTMRLEQVEAWNRKGWIVEPLYAAPVSTEAIRSEALEEVVKFLSESGLITPTGRFAEAIRGLK